MGLRQEVGTMATNRLPGEQTTLGNQSQLTSHMAPACYMVGQPWP